LLDELQQLTKGAGEPARLVSIARKHQAQEV
jgi:hypothetical protein